LLDEGPALHVAGTGAQVCLAEPLANRGSARRRRVRGCAIACGELLLRDRQQQVSLLHAVTLCEQPLRAGEPSGRASRLAAQE
jgi:hypothetical protein